MFARRGRVLLPPDLRSARGQPVQLAERDRCDWRHDYVGKQGGHRLVQAYKFPGEGGGGTLRWSVMEGLPRYYTEINVS